MKVIYFNEINKIFWNQVSLHEKCNKAKYKENKVEYFNGVYIREKWNTFKKLIHLHGNKYLLKEELLGTIILFKELTSEKKKEKKEGGEGEKPREWGRGNKFYSKRRYMNTSCSEFYFADQILFFWLQLSFFVHPAPQKKEAENRKENVFPFTRFSFQKTCVLMSCVVFIFLPIHKNKPFQMLYFR